VKADLFIVASPLHYVCAGMVSRHFGAGSSAHLFYTRSFLEPLVVAERWDSAQFLPWPRFHPLPGPFGRLRRIRANLDLVAARCGGAEEIRLHAPVIDTEAVNYHVNHLRRSFPHAVFSLRLLPDGFLNLQSNPLGRIKEIGQYGRKLRRLVFPTVDYHPLRGDRTGADDPLVDRIYLLHGMPHLYDPRKAVELPPFPRFDAGGSGKRSALVLGQPLSSLGKLPPSGVEEISRRMADFLGRERVEEVHYKRHPRDWRGDFRRPEYLDLDLAEPLETYLVRRSYDLVLGVTSTGLFTARMILGGATRVVSFGLDLMRGGDGKRKKRLMDAFALAGIEIDGSHPLGGRGG
jgi:hypothetical protein